MESRSPMINVGSKPCLIRLLVAPSKHIMFFAFYKIVNDTLLSGKAPFASMTIGSFKIIFI